MPTLLIYKNQANIIKPTLTEKVTITPPRFIFRLKGDETNDFIYFTALDTSTETQRYNKFTVTDTPNPNPLSAQVNLTAGGYTYEVYEISISALALITNLATVDYTTLNMVETGVLQCIVTPTPNTEYIEANSTNTVYSG